MGLLLELTRNV